MSDDILFKLKNAPHGASIKPKDFEAAIHRLSVGYKEKKAISQIVKDSVQTHNGELGIKKIADTLHGLQKTHPDITSDGLNAVARSLSDSIKGNSPGGSPGHPQVH